MGAFYCKQCNNFDSQDINKYGECWCNKWKSYVDPYKVATHCRYFWFIINKTYEILNIDDGGDIDDTLRLKNNYIIKNVDCFEFMNDYGKYGPVIAQKMEEDPNSKYVADYYLNHCIEPMLPLIDDHEFEKAYDIFANSFYGLANYYNVNIEEAEAVKEVMRIRKVSSK